MTRALPGLAGLAALAFLLAGLFVAGSAGAQDFERRAPGDFDFYVLALSWSPGFCALDERGDRDQCAPGRGLGFTVHGLWPQYERGYPRACEGRGGPPRAALEAVAGLYPSEALARHEWRQHGTCSGLSPSAYFGDVRRAWERVRVPEALARPDRDRRLRPVDLARAFAAENPGLRPDSIAVMCRRGVVQEVRVCLDRDLRGFHACPEVARAGCRFGEVELPAAP